MFGSFTLPFYSSSKELSYGVVFTSQMRTQIIMYTERWKEDAQQRRDMYIKRSVTHIRIYK